jgi:hypothetical protein
MKAENKDKLDKLSEHERSELNTVSSFDEEEKEHLNSLDRLHTKPKTEEFFIPLKSEDMLVIDNKINPFSLNSQSLRIEKMVNIKI